MTRDKTKELYEKAKKTMQKAKAEMDKYGRALEEMDKNDFWKTAQKYKISAEELKTLLAQREKENAMLLQQAAEREKQKANEMQEKTAEGGETK